MRYPVNFSRRFIVRFRIQSAFIACAAMVFMHASISQAALVVGVGTSSALATDAATAKAAAQAAKTQLGSVAAKAVFVYLKNQSASALQSIDSIFDPSIVYGDAGLGNMFTQFGRTASNVQIMAIGGDLSCAGFLAPSPNSAPQTTGKQIGDSIAKVSVPSGNGKVLLIYGPSLDGGAVGPVTTAIQGVLGSNYPMSGTCASSLIYKGNIVAGNWANRSMGILLWGDFSCGFGRNQPTVNEQTGLAVRASISGKDITKLSCTFIFNCTSRTGVPNELDTIKSVLGSNAKIMGSFEGGEIGKTSDTAKALGDGHMICVVSIFANNTTGVRHGTVRDLMSHARSPGPAIYFLRGSRSSAMPHERYTIGGAVAQSPNGPSGVYIDDDR
jgi:hypothetical protein